MQMPPELPTYNPYAAPVSRLEDFPTRVLMLATRWSRLGAYILDLLSFSILAIVAAIVLPSFSKAASGEIPQAFMAIIGFGMLAIFIINTIFLYKYGQTIGKRLVGIKVVQIDGSRCELWRFFVLRYFVTGLLGAIPIIGPLVTWIIDPLMIFGEEQRCLHDLIANTIVVQA